MKRLFNNLPTWAKVAVHNNYVENGGYGDIIEENTEENLNEYFGSPYEALQAVCSDFNLMDDWMWVDDLGNLHSTDLDNNLPFADIEDIAEHYLENPTYLKDLDEFDDWYDAYENGIDDEEEEDEE